MGPIAIISGSGIDLTPLLDRIDRTWAFTEIPGVPRALVPGHAGRIYQGFCGPVPVVLQAGRIHLYEGHDLDQAGATIDFIADLGVEKILLLAAAGGVSPTLNPGDLVGVTTVWTWPNRRHDLPPELPTDFLYEGLDGQGPYLSMPGPNYETRSEIEMIRRWDTSVVGMSLAAELWRCRRHGISTSAIACVANRCGAPGGVTHGEVLSCMQKASTRLQHYLATHLG